MTDAGAPVTSLSQRLRQLAVDGPDEVLLVHVAADGSEVALTAAELDRWTSQLAGEMAAKGVGVGDRVALGLRNSPELVVAAFATWRLGATPIPVRWDLPEWEQQRVLGAVDAKLVLGPDDLGWIASTAELDATNEKVDLSGLEKEFIAAAAAYSARKGISYAAWRELGVEPAVLKKAGISRSS